MPSHYTYDATVYIELGQLARAYATGGSIYGLPDKPDMPEAPEPDRKGSRLTAPGKSDADVRLAQYIRVSGLRGTSVLDRYATSEHRSLTAHGKPTRAFPWDSRGECPSERLNWQPQAEDAGTPEQEVRQLRRYRDSMKGIKFAASMEHERMARERNVMRRLVLPAWPYNEKAGRFEHGKVRINPRTGRETYRFKDGSYLDERIAAYQSLHAEEIAQAASDMDRKLAKMITPEPGDKAAAYARILREAYADDESERAAELERLIAEQKADAKAQRKGHAFA